MTHTLADIRRLPPGLARDSLMAQLGLTDTAPRKPQFTGDKSDAKRRKVAAWTNALKLLAVDALPDGVEGCTARTPNGWESEYLAMLEVQKRAGEIADYRFEPLRLRIGVGACHYKPDFVIRHNGGSIEVVEIKGHRWAAGIVRVKAAALRYPTWRWRVAKRTRGGWEYEELSL